MYPTRVPKAFLGNPINNNYQTFIKFLELNLKIIPAFLIRDIEADYTCSKDHPIKTTLFILLSIYSFQFFFCSVWSTKHYASSIFIKRVLFFLSLPPFFYREGISICFPFVYLFGLFQKEWGGGMTYWNMGSDCKDPFELRPLHNISHHSGACCRCDCAPGVPPHRSVSRWTKPPTHPTQRPLEKDKDQGQITFWQTLNYIPICRFSSVEYLKNVDGQFP